MPVHSGVSHGDYEVGSTDNDFHMTQRSGAKWDIANTNSRTLHAKMQPLAKRLRLSLGIHAQ